MFWPSWKFFEDAGWHPQLQIQISETKFADNSSSQSINSIHQNFPILNFINNPVNQIDQNYFRTQKQQFELNKPVPFAESENQQKLKNPEGPKWQNVRFSNGKIYPWSWLFNPYTNLDLCIQSLTYQCLELMNQNRFINSTEYFLLQNTALAGFKHLYSDSLKKISKSHFKIEFRIRVYNSMTCESDVAFQDTIEFSNFKNQNSLNGNELTT